VCILDGALASRRRNLGDTRFDRPRAVDATTVGALAALLGQAEATPGAVPLSLEIVTTDGAGRVRASATFAASALEPPFLASRRAVLSRLVSDPAADPGALVAPLIAYARRLAAQSGAPFLELTELSPPRSPLHRAGVESGGVPWSRIFIRAVSPRAQF